MIKAKLHHALLVPSKESTTEKIKRKRVQHNNRQSKYLNNLTDLERKELRNKNNESQQKRRALIKRTQELVTSAPSLDTLDERSITILKQNEIRKQRNLEQKRRKWLPLQQEWDEDNPCMYAFKILSYYYTANIIINVFFITIGTAIGFG